MEIKKTFLRSKKAEREAFRQSRKFDSTNGKIRNSAVFCQRKDCSSNYLQCNKSTG